jgi:predicted O-methyltransferase YrrM
MDLVHPDVDRYLGELPRLFDDPVLNQMEEHAAARGFPIVGPVVGRLLYTTAVAVGARRVLELGSGFGYSAYYFAQAVGAQGQVVATEFDAEQAAMGQEQLARAGLGNRVSFLVGDALAEAAELEDGAFDIVFNDIDKEFYPEVLPLARRLLRPGGLLVCDNMLWYGRVAQPGADADAATQGVVELTRLLFEADDFVTTLVPLRDGVTLSAKRGGDSR